MTPDYDVCGQLGLCSPRPFSAPRHFPLLTGLNDVTAGGTSIAGPPGRADNKYSIVDSIASFTWVKGNHTFKFGANLEFQEALRSLSATCRALTASAARRRRCLIW